MQDTIESLQRITESVQSSDNNKLRGQAQSNCFARLFHGWTAAYVSCFFKNNQISNQDIKDEPDLLNQHQYQQWKIIFHEMVSKNEKNSLQLSLKEILKDELRFGFLLSFLHYQTNSSVPLFIYYITINIMESNYNSSSNICLVASLILAKIIKFMTHLHAEIALKKAGDAMYRFVTKSIVDKALQNSLISNSKFTEIEISKLVHLDCQKLQQYPYLISRSYFNFYVILVVMFIVIFLSRWAGVIGMVCLFLLISVRFFLNAKWNQFEEELSQLASRRIQSTMEVFSIIKFIKVNALENQYFKKLQKLRKDQVSKLREKFCFEMIPITSVTISVRFVTMVIGVCLIALSDRFGTAMMFAIALTFNYTNIQTAVMALTQVKNTQVSLNKIQNYLVQKNIDTTYISRGDSNSNEFAIEVHNGNFNWKNNQIITQNTIETKKQFQLMDINLKVRKGSFVALIGQFGSGKTSLINAFFGEMNCTGPAKISLNGRIAYVAQKNWIMNATVRENILFGKPFSNERYSQVLHYACLGPDLQILSHGDRTMIGERGCTLSGGQKARISLARALYSDADVFILDDILSAVDAQVGAFLFSQTLRGYLKSKTVFLITHSLFYLQYTDNIFILQNGKLAAQGQFHNLKDHPIFFNIKVAANTSQPEIKIKNQTFSIQQSNIMLVEQSSLIRRGFDNFKQYIQRNGGTCFAFATIAYFLFLSFSSSFGSIWLNFWSGAEDPSSAHYAAIFIGIVLITSVFTITMARVMHMSKIYITLHDDMIKSLLYAPLSYFERIPIAKIINRLSSDLNTNDRVVGLEYFLTVSYSAANFSFLISTYYVAVAEVSIFLLISLPIYLIILGVLSYRYFVTYRQVHHLVEDAKIPVNSCFNEILSGIATIRAYDAERQERQACFKAINTLSKAHRAASGLDSWVKFIICCGSTLYLGIILLYLFFTQSNPSYDIFLIYNILSNEQFFQKLALVFTQLLVRFKSLGRCEELAKVEPEQIMTNFKQQEEKDQGHKKFEIERGEIRFINYSTRYKAGLENVLKQISLTIRAEEKIGIVGRTGSGKSSLLLCLLRVLEANEGSIQIDDKDLINLSLSDLRSNLSVILQEHFLFSGTVRQNVDPSSSHNDSEIQRALQKCGLWETLTQREGLETKVNQSGENMSVGQKQLMNIARTLLNPKRIVLVDEATASIDIHSDETVQRVLQREFKNCTVLTIAHRITSVLHSDRILVLDKGQIAEFDSPSNLLAKPNSLFAKLYQQSVKSSQK